MTLKIDYQLISNLAGQATLFHLEQAITAIRKEICADTPFAKANDTRRAEIDQLTDMIDRRR